MIVPRRAQRPIDVRARLVEPVFETQHGSVGEQNLAAKPQERCLRHQAWFARCGGCAYRHRDCPRMARQQCGSVHSRLVGFVELNRGNRSLMSSFEI